MVAEDRLVMTLFVWSLPSVFPPVREVAYLIEIGCCNVVTTRA